MSLFTSGGLGLNNLVLFTSLNYICIVRYLFSSAFVHYSLVVLLGLWKTTQPTFTELGGKMAHGPRKKRLDIGGKVIRITLHRLGWGYD